MKKQEIFKNDSLVEAIKLPYHKKHRYIIIFTSNLKAARN